MVKALDNTLIIYLPIAHDILKVKAKDEKPMQATNSQNFQELKFVKASFKNNAFLVEYDVFPSYTYPQDYGYTMGYTEEYTQTQNNLLTALYRAYGDLKVVSVQNLLETQEDIIAEKESTDEDSESQPPPDFIVLIIANITKGIEVKQFFHFADYKRLMQNSLSSEEYQRRAVYEVQGYKGIIGDETARHVAFEALTWPSFLGMQIENRVKIKYKNSAFPPGAKTDAEILKICYDTFAAYAYVDFASIELSNLYSGDQHSFTAEELLAIE